MPQYRMPISCPIVLTGLSDADLGERLAARTLELIDVPVGVPRRGRAGRRTCSAVLRAGGVEARDAGDTCVLARGAGPAGGRACCSAGTSTRSPPRATGPGAARPASFTASARRTCSARSR